MFDSPRSLRGVRRRISPLGAIVAGAALGVGLLGAGLLVAGHDDERGGAENATAGENTAPDAASDVPLAGLLPGAEAPVTADVPGAGGAGGAAIEIADAPVFVRYTFDGGVARPVADVKGGFPLSSVTQNGGALVLTPTDGGLAVRYPARCNKPENICPRAILEGKGTDSLNPGTRPLSYGATMLMNPSDTADGANVVQKGFSVGGGTQFKLQVDHEAGRPSCVIAAKQRIYRVVARTNVANGAWHNLVCTRAGSRLSITVDGKPGGSVYVPPRLSIANSEPLRVGGKGANAGNDQFAGQLDNVFLKID